MPRAYFFVALISLGMFGYAQYQGWSLLEPDAAKVERSSGSSSGPRHK